MVDIIIDPASEEKILGGKANVIHPFTPPPPPDNEERKASKDHFAIDDTTSLTEEAGKTRSWVDLEKSEKIVRVLTIVTKVCVVLALLYIFICSLDLLSVGLRITGGRTPEKLFDNNALIENPVIGLMCGILFTVIVQSSSTTSSAVVGLVAGKIITVPVAIPIIMGANIGTSVTNTLLAMLQVDDRDRFRRAFAAATIHDMFNWLTTLVLLPIETVTGYLFYTSKFLVAHIQDAEVKSKQKIKLLKALTEPVTKTVVKFNGKANASSVVDKEGTIFSQSTWSDRTIGLIVILLSFVVLLTCLYCIVQTLKSILKGKMAVWIRRTSNANLPYCPSLTEYLLILMGAVLTFLVQSSSVFTSTLPPLVSVKAISLERSYPLTLGANIGTTTTAVIAALTQTENIAEGLQIALCHFLFNISGVLLFYPLPCTRFPIQISKTLGNTTAQYRWFAIFYIVVLFVLLPLLFMGLAFAGSVYVIVTASVMLICLISIALINSLRQYPRFLPKVLHTWEWLPEWMRSLEPYDKLFSKIACCAKLKRRSLTAPSTKDLEEKGLETEEINSVPDHIDEIFNDVDDKAQSIHSRVTNKE